ncbi:PTS transporter subunit EIIC [Candidatus Enterococcus courvalinii]|uniref:PTS transporter subunit EIIC n=1 Tax=Candidatus Enterococcus courvalinii TaxID=2815329 RepID=A0ABS3I1M8_9ENTE|nr:PTS transporter subunit EIIC [Enterococcus sp. MSG2901]MBO0482615.1 PTS transporter subunit EIIC [Enterococcus sp. MSG2901]
MEKIIQPEQLLLSEQVQLLLTQLGGKNNIESITPCATRLRIQLKKQPTAESKEIIQQIPDVKYFILLDKYAEVIMEQGLNETYEALSQQLDQSATKEKLNPIEKLFGLISEIFTPIIPLFAGSGILKGLVVLATTLGWLSETSGTYHILAAASNAVFYFLPIFLAFSAAKTFKVNGYIAGVIAAALIEPNLTSLLTNGGKASTDFLGIPVVLMQYTSTVMPAILGIFFYSFVEKFLKKYIRESMQLVFVPLLSLVITVPLTLMVFGPAGVYLGEGLAAVITWMMDINGPISGAIIAGGWNILVIFGIQWAVNPVMISNISSFGFDRIVPLTGAANFGMAGAALGVFLKSKQSRTRSISGSAFASILLAGVTEPTVYGIAIPLKKPFVAACIGAAAGGAVMGFAKVKAIAFVFGSLTTLPAFISSTFWWYVIGLAVSLVVAMITTLVSGFDETLMPQE